MIAVPIQADADLANVAIAAAYPANQGSQGENAFAQVLLNAVGSESQPPATAVKLGADPDLDIPNPEEEQKNAEAILALNLTVPVMPVPVIDVGNVLGPVMAGPSIEPTRAPAEETSEASLQPLVSVERGGPAGGAAEQVVSLPNEFKAAPADTLPAPASGPDLGNPESSATPDVPLPPLTASTQPPAACTQPAVSTASAEPAGVCVTAENASPFVSSTVEESAHLPRPTESVSSPIPAMENKSGPESVPRPAAAEEMPAQVEVEAQGASPAPQTGVIHRPADAMIGEETTPVSIQPEQKPGEPILRTVMVGHAFANPTPVGHPARDLPLPISSHDATVVPTPGQASEKPQTDGGGSEHHEADISPGQSQVDTRPANTAVKTPSDKERAMATPVVALQNSHGSEAVSVDREVFITVPPLSLTNRGIADSGSLSPAMKSHPLAPADANPNLLPATDAVNVARIVDRVGQSEMHIGLRTLAFGNVEVHTVVRDSQVGLAVGSEKGDLRTLLTAEIPGLQTKFHQHDLHLDNIRFLEHGPGFDTGFSAGADSQSRSFQQRGGAAPRLPGFGVSAADPGDIKLAGDTRTGLNVHA